MAVGASHLVSIAESSFAIVADGTLEHRSFALFHLEYVVVAVSTFDLLLVDVDPMAKSYTTRTSVGLIYDIAAVCSRVVGSTLYY